MRVVFLSWEYPPRVVGELAWKVQAQVEKLRSKDIGIDVVTISDTGYFVDEPYPRVRITRITSPVWPHSTIITWIASINVEAARVVADIYHSENDTLILHTHDWHLTPAALALKKAFSLPWVSSIYSIEQQRSLNPNSPLSSCIRTIEWHASLHCDYLILENEWMVEELMRHVSPNMQIVKVVSPYSQSYADEVYQIYTNMVRAHEP